MSRDNSSSSESSLLREVVAQNSEILSKIATLEERSLAMNTRILPDMKDTVVGHESRIRQLENGIISLSNLSDLPTRLQKLDDELGVLTSMNIRIENLESSTQGQQVMELKSRIEGLESRFQWFAGVAAAIMFLLAFFGKSIRVWLGLS